MVLALVSSSVLGLRQLTVTLSDTKLAYVEDLLQNQRGAYQEDARTPRGAKSSGVFETY